MALGGRQKPLHPCTVAPPLCCLFCSSAEPEDFLVPFTHTHSINTTKYAPHLTNVGGKKKSKTQPNKKKSPRQQLPLTCQENDGYSLSALLLPLMQQAPVLWMKVSCVWSKHWGLRSKKKTKMVLDYLILMTSFFKRLSVQDNVTHVH